MRLFLICITSHCVLDCIAMAKHLVCMTINILWKNAEKVEWAGLRNLAKKSAQIFCCMHLKSHAKERENERNNEMYQEQQQQQQQWHKDYNHIFMRWINKSGMVRLWRERSARAMHTVYNFIFRIDEAHVYMYMMYLYAVFIVYIVLVSNGVLISAETNAIRFNANVQKYVYLSVCIFKTAVAMATATTAPTASRRH